MLRWIATIISYFAISSPFFQNVSNRAGHNRSNTAPSISITPLPGRGGANHSGSGGSGQRRSIPSSSGIGQQGAGMRPGAPASGGKGSFVICEICDGYIKDLEQLRNHMLWIHKVKHEPLILSFFSD